MTKFFDEVVKTDMIEVVPNFIIGDNDNMYPEEQNEDFVAPGFAIQFPEINDEDFSGTDHESYLYVIMDGQRVYKIGQTEKALLRWTGGFGFVGRRDYIRIKDYGPKRIMANGGRHESKSRPNAFDTTNRIGAYFSPGTSAITENKCNEELRESIMKDEVSLWAIKSPVLTHKITIAGKTREISYGCSKEMEGSYLDIYKEMNQGELPPGNPMRS